MSIGIDSLIGNISSNERSHKAGWARLWKHILERKFNCNIDILNKNSNWNDYDTIYIDPGMEVATRYLESNKYSLNLFGGASEDLYNKLNKVLEFKGSLISLDIPFQNIGEGLKKRLKNSSTYNLFNEEFCIKLDNILKMKGWITQETYEYKNIILGDSHSLAQCPSNAACLRHDGKTLHGALKNNLIKKTVDVRPNLKTLSICFGSIDIRHHLCRFDNPKKEIKDLTLELEKQLLEIRDKLENIELCYAVPVEHEERKLPKTGYYRGTPFFGSREERLELTLYYNSLLKQLSGKHGFLLNELPETWYYMDGKEYAELIMEKPQSVHISYPYYRWSTNYGENNGS